MSLVGPRPLPVAYLPRYNDRRPAGWRSGPGITGWAQVNGRNTTGWDERLAMDVWYVDHASLAPGRRASSPAPSAWSLHGSGVDHAPGVTMTEFDGPAADGRGLPVRPLRVAHLTTVDMSLALLLEAQLDAVIAAGGEAIGISAPGPFVGGARAARRAPHPARARRPAAGTCGPTSERRSQLWRILRRERPTVLHTHNPKPGRVRPGHRSPRRRADRRQHRPRAVRHARRSAASAGRSSTRWRRSRRAGPTSSWSRTSRTSKLMRRRRLVGSRKLRHLGNGVDLRRFDPDRQRRRACRAACGVGHRRTTP